MWYGTRYVHVRTCDLTLQVRTRVRKYVRTYCAFAPSLNWLPCILPKHTWFSVHMCALFQSESCDITSQVRTNWYVPGTNITFSQKPLEIQAIQALRCNTCTDVRTIIWYVRTYVRTRVRTTIGTIFWYHAIDSLGEYVRTYVRTHVRTYVHVDYHVMSQLSDWKRAHMCTESRCVLAGDTAASRERMRGNTHLHSRHRPHHCLNDEVYRGNRHYERHVSAPPAHRPPFKGRPTRARASTTGEPGRPRQ
jgi:hypothetical protein